MLNHNFKCVDLPICPNPRCKFKVICGKYQEQMVDELYQEWIDVQDSNESFLIKARQG